MPESVLQPKLYMGCHQDKSCCVSTSVEVILSAVKMHILCYLYEDYFELTGETLHKVSDEVTESVHSRYRMFEEKHGYSCNKKGSMDPIRKQPKSVIHFDSLNIGDV